MLERLYRMTGETQAAAMAARQVSSLKNLPHEVVRAGSLFSDGELSLAEISLRKFLRAGGDHVEALRLLARIENKLDEPEEAERLLEDALEQAPDYRAARSELVRVLLDGQKYLEALDVIETQLKLEPDSSDLLFQYATACAGLGRYESAIALYRQLIGTSPNAADLHMALGHSLKCAGRQEECIQSYHAAATVKPTFGDAYWSLANLKTYRFSEEEIVYMRAQEAATSTQLVDRYHLCFALGKAYEDRNEYLQSWQFYERGNTLKRGERLYRPEIIEINTRKQIEVCTRGLFAARQGVGAADHDPVFIVGLPRSGSTLVEQILASHSQVDATQELPNIPRIVRQLQGPRPDLENPRYPGVLAGLAPEEFRRLGNRYLIETRAYRGSKPFFIDKMPNNFRHIGLITLMLPNAKIIDVRREPVACCFGNLKHLFASGQDFTYSVEDIARYYRTYLDLMRHWDAVLPGRILRVFYEDIAIDLRGNVGRILEFCGLDFEPTCLEFYKTERWVATASSEQVRSTNFSRRPHAVAKLRPVSRRT